MGKLKKWVGLILCGVMLLSQLSLPASAAMFSDINGHWCQGKIEAWAGSGVINGYGDGTFRPSADITRAEFIKLVNRVFKFTRGKAIKFTDVKAEDWYFSELQIAYNEGYISGYEDGTVRPQKPITRQEVAKVITTLLGLQENAVTTWSFTDYDNMDTWARGYIGAVVDANIMSGYSSGPYVGTFGGRRNITRAEVVEALWKANEHNADPPVTDLTVTAASYKPSSLQTVKDLYIQYPDNVDISNLMVLGSIYVDSRLGASTVTLTNVTCSNNLAVDQGNWILDSCDIKNINLGYKGSVVTLKNRSTVKTATVARSATIDHTGLANGYKGIEDITVACNDTSVVTLKGNFDNINIDTAKQNVNLASGKIENMSITRSGVEVTLTSGTVLNYVYIGAASRVIGPGTVRSANVESTGVVMQRAPATLLGSRTPSYLGDYTLNFLITDAASKKVMNGVTVTLNDFNEVKKTGTNGQARFDNIAGGTINYTVAMAGYKTIQQSVQVSGTNKVVELEMTPQGTWSAELTVQDSLTGKVLQGATAKIQMGATPQSAANTSGPNGKLWFYNLGNATYTYTVSCAGYVTSAPATFTVNNKDFVLSTPVKLVPTTLNITAEAAATGEKIKTFSVKDPYSGEFVSTTNGTIALRYLTVGTTYNIEVRATGFSNKIQSVVLTDQATNAVKVLMNSDRAHDFRVTVNNSNEPVKGATVTLQNSGWTKTITTDADGNAFFAGVPEAKGYSMTVVATGHQKYEASGIEINGNELNRAMVVRLYTLRNPKLTFVLEDGKGGKKPIAGAQIYLQAQNNKDVKYPAAGATVTTDANGVATLTNVPDGAYYVFCSHRDYSLIADDLETGAVEFVLGLNSTEKELFAQEKQITVTLVFSYDGKPNVGAQITLKRTSDELTKKGVTINGGISKFELPVGDYEVLVEIEEDIDGKKEWVPHSVIGNSIIRLTEDGAVIPIDIGAAKTTP